MSFTLYNFQVLFEVFSSNFDLFLYFIDFLVKKRGELFDLLLLPSFVNQECLFIFLLDKWLNVHSPVRWVIKLVLRLCLTKCQNCGRRVAIGTFTAQSLPLEVAGLPHTKAAFMILRLWSRCLPLSIINLWD